MDRSSPKQLDKPGRWFFYLFFIKSRDLMKIKSWDSDGLKQTHRGVKNFHTGDYDVILEYSTTYLFLSYWIGIWNYHIYAPIYMVLVMKLSWVSDSYRVFYIFWNVDTYCMVDQKYLIIWQGLYSNTPDGFCFKFYYLPGD